MLDNERTHLLVGTKSYNVDAENRLGAEVPCQMITTIDAKLSPFHHYLRNGLNVVR